MNVVICPSSHSFSFVCSKAYLISSNRRVLNSMLRATRLLHIRILLEDIVSSRLDWKKVKKVFVVQLCPTLCDLIDCSLLGSCVHGVLQARVLEWVAMPFSRDLPDSGIEPKSPTRQADSLPLSHQRKREFMFSANPLRRMSSVLPFSCYQLCSACVDL